MLAMTSHPAHQLLHALQALGGLLEHRGERFEVMVSGGAGLLLLGVLDRPTQDVDLLALLEEGEVVSAAPLPIALASCAEEIALDRGLPKGWLNPGPTSLLDLGLPEGIFHRCQRWDYGGLVVHAVGRLEQIHFKLYAAVDQGPESKHASDLKLLNPSVEELRLAATWCRLQDASDTFAKHLNQAVTWFTQEQGRA